MSQKQTMKCKWCGRAVEFKVTTQAGGHRMAALTVHLQGGGLRCVGSGMSLPLKEIKKRLD